MNETNKLNSFGVEALKNFAAINPSLLIMPGNVIKTTSSDTSIIARIELDDAFNWKMPIYDMNQFLGVVTSMENPELKNDPDGKYVEISSGRAKTKIYYGSETLNVFREDLFKKDIQFPDSVIDFTLTEATFKEIMKMSQILQVPHMVVSVRAEKIFITAKNTDNKTGPTYDVEVGEAPGVADNEWKLRVDILKFLPGDYNVSMAENKISRFSHTKAKIEYLVAIEVK